VKPGGVLFPLAPPPPAAADAGGTNKSTNRARNENHACSSLVRITYALPHQQNRLLTSSPAPGSVKTACWRHWCALPEDSSSCASASREKFARAGASSAAARWPGNHHRCFGKTSAAHARADALHSKRIRSRDGKFRPTSSCFLVRAWSLEKAGGVDKKVFGPRPPPCQMMFLYMSRSVIGYPPAQRSWV